MTKDDGAEPRVGVEPQAGVEPQTGVERQTGVEPRTGVELQTDRTAGSAFPSDPAKIEELIAQRRAHLSSTIDELAARAQPREIARRSAADMKGRFRAFVTTPDGELRTERLAAVAGAVTAVVVALVLLRRRSNR